MINIFKKFFYSKPIQAYIRFVQKILVTILLTLLYFIGAPLTLLVILIFKRSIIIKRYKDKNTYWEDAYDYTSDFQTSLHQS